MSEGKKKKHVKKQAEGKVQGKQKPTKEGAASKVRKLPDGVVNVKHGKAIPERPRLPYTGTRFKPNTSQQTAYDIIRDIAKGSGLVDDAKKLLTDYRKENGKPRNLDSGYFPFVVASHPEDFEVCRQDGTMKVKLLQDVKPDEKAIAALEEKRKAAKAARESRSGEKKSKPAKPAKGGKPMKPVKGEKGEKTAKPAGEAKKPVKKSKPLDA